MKGGMYQTNGLEHDETARPASSHVMHEKMNAKRYRKLAFVEEKYPLFQRLGPEKADVGIVCWGSSKGPVEEAMREPTRGGVKRLRVRPADHHAVPEEGAPRVHGEREDARLPRGQLRRRSSTSTCGPSSTSPPGRASSRGRAA